VSTATLPYVTEADPAIRLASLLAARGMARELTGDAEGARQDLRDSIEVFDRKRRQLDNPIDRLRAFEQERVVFKRLVRLQAQRLPIEALRTSERARAGSWIRAGMTADLAVDPEVSARELSSDVAILYYEVLSDRILSWVLTREGVSFLETKVAEADLERSIAQTTSMMAKGANFVQARVELSRLHEWLIRPAVARISSRSSLVVVPDRALYTVPFAALANAEGRPLVERFAIIIAPSVTDFIASSRVMSRFEASSIVALGAGHDPKATGLPFLPRADSEAAAVTQKYPVARSFPGGQARASRFLADREEVVHFAGHAVTNRSSPLLSTLQLAPDVGAASGALTAGSLLTHSFVRTRLVVLASCEAAIGRVVEGEGLVGLSRVLLATGVGNVVSSILPVSDDNGSFFVEFHNALRTTKDPATALRATQLHAFSAHESVPLNQWAGFTSFGGRRAPATPGENR